jgi:hypothetical protein
MHTSAIVNLLNKISPEDLLYLVDKETDIILLTKNFEGKSNFKLKEFYAWIAYAHRSRDKAIEILKQFSLQELERLESVVINQISSMYNKKAVPNDNLLSIITEIAKEKWGNLTKDLEAPIFLFDCYEVPFQHMVNKILNYEADLFKPLFLYKPESYTLTANTIVTNSNPYYVCSEIVDFKEFQEMTGFYPKESFWKRVSNIKIIFRFRIIDENTLRMFTEFECLFLPRTKYTTKEYCYNKEAELAYQVSHIFKPKDFPVKVYNFPTSTPIETIIQKIKSKEAQHV